MKTSTHNRSYSCNNMHEQHWVDQLVFIVLTFREYQLYCKKRKYTFNLWSICRKRWSYHFSQMSLWFIFLLKTPFHDLTFKNGVRLCVSSILIEQIKLKKIWKNIHSLTLSLFWLLCRNKTTVKNASYMSRNMWHLKLTWEYILL